MEQIRKQLDSLRESIEETERNLANLRAVCAVCAERDEAERDLRALLY